MSHKKSTEFSGRRDPIERLASISFEMTGRRLFGCCGMAWVILLLWIFAAVEARKGGGSVRISDP
jgi:hypothetical protein